MPEHCISHRMMMPAQISGTPANSNGVDISVIVVSYNTAHLLHEAIDALRNSASGFSIEIIFVDNASSDGSAKLIREEFADCRLIENMVNVGFGRANNQALAFANGRYILLLNTDAFVSTDTLKKTMTHMESNARCGILGVKLVGRNGEMQPSARYFPTPWNLFLKRTGLHRLSMFNDVRLVDDLEWDHLSVRACDWVPGCYYLVRKEVISQVGLFDPRYFLYYEEVDHCFAAKKAGWEVIFFPDTTVIHIGGESARSDGEVTASGRQLDALRIESELLYFRKNHGLIAVFLNLALTFLSELMVILRRMAKFQASPRTRISLNRMGLIFSLFYRTRWARQPTR